MQLSVIQDKRKALLATIYTSFDSTTLSPTLADDLKLTGAGKHVQSKQGMQPWLAKSICSA